MPLHDTTRRLTIKQRLTIAAVYAGSACTLNGHLARIASSKTLPTAFVAACDGSASREYAWAAVERIMSQEGGNFTT